MDNKLNVLVFGKSGVGKTTLLATMFESLRDSDIFARIKSESPNDDVFEKTLIQLNKFIRSLTETETEGINPTSIEKNFKYKLSTENAEHSIHIDFKDIPGEWLDEKDRKEELINHLNSSNIIIIVVSTPAIMEKNRNYNLETNNIGKLTDFISNTESSDTQSTKLFIIVPVKCEKYIEDPKSLKETVKEVYKSNINRIGQKGHYCYYIPVSTLGTVVFKEFEIDNNGNFKEIYKLKDKNNTGRHPKNHNALLSKIIDYCINTTISNFPQSKNELAPIVGSYTELLKEIDCLVEGKKPIKYPIVNYGCFIGSTLIETDKINPIPISDIKPGDRVLTRDSKGLLEYQEVTKTSFHNSITLIRIKINNNYLYVTEKHLIRRLNNWTHANKLLVGDIVNYYDKNINQIVNKAVEEIDTNLIVSDAYNIYTRKNSNYFANGVLVSTFILLNKSRSILERFKSIIYNNQGVEHESIR